MTAATETALEGVRVLGEENEATARVLTPGALEFVAGLHRRFNATRQALLADRERRQAEQGGRDGGAEGSTDGEHDGRRTGRGRPGFPAPAARGAPR